MDINDQRLYYLLKMADSEFQKKMMIPFLTLTLTISILLTVTSVVEWSVCSTAVREGTGSIPAGDNVVIPVFPPKATCPLSSDQNLAL